MGNFIDLTGQKFGRLTVIEMAEKVRIKNTTKIYWKCLCDCGNEKNILLGSLRSGRTKSCGCLKSETTKEKNKNKKIDLTGKRYGRLLVIRENGKSKNNNTKWLCQCDCGNETTVTGGNLSYGSVKSCGCLAKEETSKRRKSSRRPNKYNLENEFGIGYVDDKEFYFDLEDYNKIKEFNWSINKYGYLTSSYNGKRIMFHQIILDKLNDEQVPDHKNRNPLDNRKENLRASSRLENSWNKSVSKRNTSGVTGVSSYNWGDKHWRSCIDVNHKRIIMGYFANFDDAVKARLQAEKQYYGEFAPQKHLFEQYGIEE
jgi:hypothetical protein